jgi:hypothetical protein
MHRLIRGNTGFARMVWATSRLACRSRRPRSRMRSASRRSGATERQCTDVSRRCTDIGWVTRTVAGSDSGGWQCVMRDEKFLGTVQSDRLTGPNLGTGSG